MTVVGRKPRLERVRIADVVSVSYRGRTFDALIVETNTDTREVRVRPCDGQHLPRGLGQPVVPWRAVQGWRSSQLGLFEAPAKAGSAIHV
jgi:hypothetical protein